LKNETTKKNMTVAVLDFWLTNRKQASAG